jgi:glutamate--glyoxylate aminotransferase
VGVRSCLNALIRDARDGVLVPIPQYPLYSASIALYGGSLVPYALNEAAGWALDVADMTKAVADARNKGISSRGLVFINPGNPTGQCLPEDNLKALIKFAYDNKIVLMADEVYQENIYQDKTPFVSARKVMNDMGEPYASHVELISFHTVSKGSLGECGLRGGYFEMKNIAQEAVDEIYKVASINLSPNVVGQVAMSLMVNPPAAGTPARAELDGEKAAILASLRKRAHIMTDGFNSLEGVTCNFTEGAMYSFPQLRLPKKALAAAKAAGKAPDVFYCLALVEQTGISTVPGSGFGQAPGTFHLRTTILPTEEKMADVVKRLQKFHANFMNTYKD